MGGFGRAVSQKPEGEFSDRTGLEDLLKCRLLGPVPRDYSSVGPGQPRICVSNELSYDAAAAADPEITL